MRKRKKLPREMRISFIRNRNVYMRIYEDENIYKLLNYIINNFNYNSVYSDYDVFKKFLDNNFCIYDHDTNHKLYFLFTILKNKNCIKIRRYADNYFSVNSVILPKNFANIRRLLKLEEINVEL